MYDVNLFSFETHVSGISFLFQPRPGSRCVAQLVGVRGKVHTHIFPFVRSVTHAIFW